MSPGHGVGGLRSEFGRLVHFQRRESSFELLSERVCEGYREQRVHFAGVEGQVPAFLLVPDGPGPFPAVMVLHQHHSQWHLGKSEVIGVAGDPQQAFGPKLAKNGIAVLAPDMIGFEDRRPGGPGVDERDDDWLQYFNQMAYRLISGRLLATAILGDSACGISALVADPRINSSVIGAVGHSHGGNMTVMLAALDDRVSFVCASGSACSYKRRMLDQTGIEFAHVIPGILELADIEQIITLIAPRPVLLVSATDDPYSADATEIVEAATRAWLAFDAPEAFEHVCYSGGHALTAERGERIVSWVNERCQTTRG